MEPTSTPITIGPYQLSGQAVLAPMAGVTDRPFRILCRERGAALAASEMVISDPKHYGSRKSQCRMEHNGERAPKVVQIAGGDAEMMAISARENVARGAQIIDINMGCPAKKVCRKAAGSALMKDEKLVHEILIAVVNSVDVPVTLKIRTGWEPHRKNAVTIARMAEDLGIKALAVHGRTRACRYQGVAEYDTIADVAKAVNMPVFANGDIDSPIKAMQVLDYTRADGVMIGRGAQGRPWLFEQINVYLTTGELPPDPSLETVQAILLRHLQDLHQFYGEYMGVRIARKHLGWYINHQPGGIRFKQRFNRLESAAEQLASAQDFFERLINGEVMAA